MDEKPQNAPDTRFSKKIGAAAERKLRAQRHRGRSIWFGLGTIGVIGWSVALPAVLGALVGAWIDRRHPGRYSWTLMLLVIGIVLGCWNAAHWVAQEQKQISKSQED